MFDPQFGALFWGKLVSAAGVWTHGIVASIVVYAATRSALMVGVVNALQFAPQILLGPLSGKLADRGHAVRQMITGRIVCATGSGLVAIWALVDVDVDGSAAAMPYMAGSLLVGLGFVVGGPAMHSIVPNLVTPAELPAAMVLNAVPMTVARILGPVLGATAAVSFGPFPAFAFATMSHVLFTILLVVARLPGGTPRAASKDLSIRSGLAYVFGDRSMRLLMAAVAATGIGAEPSMTLAPAIADNLSRGPGLVGAITASFGLGASAGLVIFTPLNRRWGSGVVASAGLWLMVAGVLLAAVPWVPTMLAAFALAGFGFTSTFTSVSTLLQERAAEELRGRVMAIWLICFLGARPFASALEGTITDLLSVHVALCVVAASVGAIAVLCRPAALRPATAERDGEVPALLTRSHA